jgi:hypothetical protein
MNRLIPGFLCNYYCNYYNNPLFGVKMARWRLLIPVLALLLGLAACASSIPFQVQEFNSGKFSPAQSIHIESGDEIVRLSSRLGNELTRAGFKISSSKEDAAYILTFDYNAEFDVYPWVVTSFTLSMIEAASGDVIYKLASAKSGREPVDSLLKRIAGDMSSKLLRNSARGNVALRVGNDQKSGNGNQ